MTDRVRGDGQEGHDQLRALEREGRTEDHLGISKQNTDQEREAEGGKGELFEREGMAVMEG